jgi:amino acid adenylation domain-containing protein
MSRVTGLHELLDDAAKRRAGHVAVESADGATISYGELAALSDRLRDHLATLNVGPGDRVAVYLTKSIDAVAAILGTLKAGAAYVPLDPNAPASRNAYIVADCRVSAIVVEARFAESLYDELRDAPPMLVVDGAGDGKPLDAALSTANAPTTSEPVRVESDDLAYVLYTSGSTGRPKGVMLSHRNALSFVDWCSETFSPTPDDRFSSHAPLHFDLSILDLYVPLKHGATLCLFGFEVGKDPARLAPQIAERRISVWYSAPSILGLLAQYGKSADHDFSALRMILFAGEVFPIKHLRMLMRLLPQPRYFNLYGPTETNVCTWHEVVGPIPDDQTEPVPIGKTCSHSHAWVTSPDGTTVNPGDEGELCICGPGVTEGYWNLPEQTADAFIIDDRRRRWYRTGDLVIENRDGDFVFRGRRDRMVKKRGYRIELGEIEACLYRHPNVRQAAVVALPVEDGLRIKAFVCPRTEQRLSIIALKQFCSEHLPVYMVPDLFAFPESLPTTSTDKIDYQALARQD